MVPLKTTAPQHARTMRSRSWRRCRWPRTASKQLSRELAPKDWRPRMADDWLALDELGPDHHGREIRPIASRRAGADAIDEQQAVIREADKVVAELRSVRWQDAEQMRPINEHAGKDRAPYGGAFVFGRVKKLFRGDDEDAALLIDARRVRRRILLAARRTDREIWPKEIACWSWGLPIRRPWPSATTH